LKDQFTGLKNEMKCQFVQMVRGYKEQQIRKGYPMKKKTIHIECALPLPLNAMCLIAYNESSFLCNKEKRTSVVIFK